MTLEDHGVVTVTVAGVIDWDGSDAEKRSGGAPLGPHRKQILLRIFDEQTNCANGARLTNRQGPRPIAR